MHFHETKEAHADEFGLDPDFFSVLEVTFKEYWGSFIVAFIAVLFSIFVFILFGFHTLIISLNLTT